MAVLGQYLWLVIVGAIGAFTFGFGTGANDVANAFGTSIGSKALTLKQAAIIASIFEFVGALVLGRVSTNTIAGGIADVSSFVREPEIYAYGMSCALWVGGIWQIIASHFELNVSATHSIIGGIIGFAMVYDGADGVKWAQRDKNSFPPYKGVLPIILSWFIAPILSAAASALFFFILRTVVLRRRNAFRLSFWVLPPLVFIVTWINMYFVFTKGAKKYIEAEGAGWSDTKSVWVSLVIAVGFFLLTCILAVPWVKYAVNKRIEGEDEPEVNMTQISHGVEVLGNASAIEIQETNDVVETTTEVKPNIYDRIFKVATHGLNVDVHKVVKHDPIVQQIHERAEKFDPHVEYVFAYLQVFSAICVIFAHGAGEVGYMAGPLATIWDVYSNGKLSSKVTPQIWIILVSAIGLVVGLSTYGYNVTRAMGVKLAKLSPTRGMCAELAVAFIIMIGAQYTLPTSSSQCITGAIVGIGLMEGLSGVNWKVFLEQFASWVMTLVVIGLCTAALFSQGVYSPSVVSGKEVMKYENNITTLSKDILVNFNNTLQSYESASGAGILGPQFTMAKWQEVNNFVNNIHIINLTTTQTTNPDVVLNQLEVVLGLVQQYTIDTLGQKAVYPGVELCNSNSTNTSTNTTIPCKSIFLT